jgi:glycosyltransferase involved in cell wall biosynthesis
MNTTFVMKRQQIPWRILYVAYPLLTVSEESAGGAEQVLWILEREVSRRGIHTTVAASSGSSVAGELFATGDPCRALDDFDRRNHEHQDQVVELLRRRARQGQPFDLVHDMSGSFWTRAQEVGVPLLATLHLPRSFYPRESLENISANVAFNFVSQAQASTFRDLLSNRATVVNNGIALNRFVPNLSREERDGLLWLGRICEEKAPHRALEIARQASLPITLAGQTYPFSYHRRYFETEVAPRLSSVSNSTFLSVPSVAEKHRLLRRAQALLITSQVEETSSLVAMEATASGTPVIAFRRGALAEVVREGVTGFIVDGVDGAVRALSLIGEISSAVCALHAREHFSSQAMADRYLHLYSQTLSLDPRTTGVFPTSPSAAA